MHLHDAELGALHRLRHPHVLRVVEVIEENKKFLAFVTERIVGSVANVYVLVLVVALKLQAACWCCWNLTARCGLLQLWRHWAARFLEGQVGYRVKHPVNV